MDYIAKACLDAIADAEEFCSSTGILYMIENEVNNKVYIGITSNTFVRRYGLRFESHNEHLMRSIEKYGLCHFYAYIIKAGVENYSELQDLEMELIKEYRSNQKEFGYNKTLGGEGTLGYEFTEEDYLRIHVPVVALDRAGKFVKEYESQKQAYEELGVYLSDCLKMRTRLAHDLIWIYKDEYDQMTKEDIEERVEWANSGLTQIKPIIALDRDGSFVQEFPSVIDASKELECSCGTIVNCCKHLVKTFRGFIWFYKKEYEGLTAEKIEDILSFCNENERGVFSKENLSIPIVALDQITGEYVNRFASAHDAEVFLKIADANGHIIACCKGKLVSCYGYKWCYEEDYLNKTPVYLQKIHENIKGRRAVVALDIETGAFVRKYNSITEAMRNMNKVGGGSISFCCTGRLNYAYGFRWMYEDEYEREKYRISEIIDASKRQKQKNRSKCRSIPVVIVFENQYIQKNSIREMAEFFLQQYQISNVANWFKKRGVPQKYKEKVSFCGTLKKYKEEIAIE